MAAAAGATLGLAGEEGGGDGGAQAVVDGKVAGAEVVAENRRLVDGAARHLLEEHEHHAVDPRRRPRALVAYHLATCMRACIYAANYWKRRSMHTESPMHGFLLFFTTRSCGFFLEIKILHVYKLNLRVLLHPYTYQN